MDFAVGQMWSYGAPPEAGASRIVIGALLEFGDGVAIACCSVLDALQRMPDGGLEHVTIPFLPMTVSALRLSVTACEGEAAVAATFAEHFSTWRDDPRGLSFFTVPFESTLDRMIARQMADIIGEPAAT